MPYQNMSPAVQRPSAQRRHALLYVGLCNRKRYTLSLIRWTRLLRDMYGYPLENIRILVGEYLDPTWPTMEPGTAVTYNATKTDLDNALADYGTGGAHALTGQDTLFIFTFNHGGTDSAGSHLTCSSYTSYPAADFANRISAIHCGQIVLLAAQCRAGGFVQPFINALAAGTRGAVLSGSAPLQDTWEAVFDKLCASAFNGRMVQDPLDDNIDIGITGEGVGETTVPGYSTDRISWGPNGVISTLEAFNWVVAKYAADIYPHHPEIIETPLYDQKPWTVEGQPVYIRLGEPELIMQDTSTDSGAEPCTDPVPWYSPDLYADNTDAYPAAGQHEYVPGYNNRFFVRIANRGTAPTDNVSRHVEVRGLSSAGGVVGPPQTGAANETVAGVTATARLRPGRAHTEFVKIQIGGDYGHGCVSAATSCALNPLSYPMWSITADNAQAQCNLDPAAVSAGKAEDPDASNARIIFRTIPVTAVEGGVFELKPEGRLLRLPVEWQIKPERMELGKGQSGEFVLQFTVRRGVDDGHRGSLPVHLLRNGKPIGGVTFQFETASAMATVLVTGRAGLPAPGVEVYLRQPGDPRTLRAKTAADGRAVFGPLNPGFYLAGVKSGLLPVRAYVAAGKRNLIRLSALAVPGWPFAEPDEREPAIVEPA